MNIDESKMIEVVLVYDKSLVDVYW